MKIAAAAIAAFLERPAPAARAVLIYGPDLGLVRERGEALVATVVADPADPFRVAELAGAALAKDPARLADEAAALSFTGGRRAVRVRPAGNEVADIFARFLKDPAGDALIVVEAGELDGRSALRRLFEGAANAAAIACYRDEGRELAGVIRDTLAGEGVSATPEALAWLASRLGGDRLVTRSELDKLAIYVGPGAVASLEDAQACVGDSADIDLDDLAHAVAGGDVPRLEQALARVTGEGMTAPTIVRAVARHFTRLHLAAGLIAAGNSEKSAMMSLRPPVFWKEETAFRAHLKRLTLPAVGRALTALLEAEIACKTGGAPAGLVAARCLLSLARQA
ncbi:MAG: DNA polymerase III subunit delta [Pseudomonadota bacterium]